MLKHRNRLTVTGVVQGVGFRPFVYGLAARLDLKGWVCNTSSGVTVEIEGGPDAVSEFQISLTRDAPPLARIEQVTAEDLPPDGFTRFEIRESRSEAGAFQPISPDISICPDCLRELFDPNDRRYLYPFINCTNCGPRFTIIKDIPYDRPQTTMAPFEMCPDCAREYHDPLNRRFHAQPVACPVCGPQVWLVHSDADERRLTQIEAEKISVHQRLSASLYLSGGTAITEAQRLLADGKTVAVKGLGGFHLACDATNKEAVAELRRRKGRVDKPFALMMADTAAVEHYCHVSPEERALLESRERPIVLLWKRAAADPPIAPSVAPHQRMLGVVLPYTPLHYLLFNSASLHPSPFIPHPLVMTSGNFSEEPIATGNDDALGRLAPLADAFLLHDRDIHIRTDDSVMRVFAGAHDRAPLPIRRSRGYAPFPVKLPFSVPPILAVGGELKNTFCVTRDRYAFMSHHIGDMENLETLQSFEEGVAHFESLFRIAPEIIAYDLHPDYLSTRYALSNFQLQTSNLNSPISNLNSAIRNPQSAISIPVQHHHAHIAACMAENGLDGQRPAIGVAFDGTGYGTDGTIWGGEFLIADYAGFERAAHLAYVPLPGGDAATRKPARVALAHLLAAGVSLDSDLPPLAALSATEQRIVERQVATGLNSPPTSSMGRLFDAVASIIGLRQEVNYEGQAAIELEAIADPMETGAYPFEMEQGSILPQIMIRAVVEGFRAGVAPAALAARFHNSVATLIRDMSVRLREQHGLNQVALSGGVFQNVTLLAKSLMLLQAAGFEVFIHRQVPPNDGGIALGQAMVAYAQSNTHL
ncbi:MAG: carbamoyltransferase HypF [Chloroflexi bacterium]|nr:carbamoyltransferase HypF [Chloroflexota bacterium]